MADTETAPAGTNTLAFVPSAFVLLGWTDPLSLIFCLIYEISILTFIFLPVPFFHGLQEQTVASYLFSLAITQIISAFTTAWIIFLPVAIVAFFVSIIFTRNDKFYNLFSAIGAGYIFAYLFVILFGVESLTLPVCIFLLAMVGMIILKKADRKIHFGVIAGILTGIISNILLSNVTPFDIMQKVHYPSKARFLYASFIWLIFLLTGSIAFLWMVYKDQFKEKIKEFKDKRTAKAEGEEAS